MAGENVQSMRGLARESIEAKYDEITYGEPVRGEEPLESWPDTVVWWVFSPNVANRRGVGKKYSQVFLPDAHDNAKVTPIGERFLFAAGGYDLGLLVVQKGGVRLVVHDGAAARANTKKSVTIAERVPAHDMSWWSQLQSDKVFQSDLRLAHEKSTKGDGIHEMKVFGKHCLVETKELTNPDDLMGGAKMVMMRLPIHPGSGQPRDILLLLPLDDRGKLDLSGLQEPGEKMSGGHLESMIGPWLVVRDGLNLLDIAPKLTKSEE